MGRFATAWRAFWGILGSQETADCWETALRSPQTALPEAAAASPEPEDAAAISADAVYTLVLLQREGRLIDFLQEDIGPYSDAQVGAAVRQIHDGCARVLQEHFSVARIQAGAEGGPSRLPEGFDSRQIRITGHPSGDPPFEGTLRHGGWKVTKVAFPQRHRDLDPAVICPAEVEIL